MVLPKLHMVDMDLNIPCQQRCARFANNPRCQHLLCETAHETAKHISLCAVHSVMTAVSSCLAKVCVQRSVEGSVGVFFSTVLLGFYRMHTFRSCRTIYSCRCLCSVAVRGRRGRYYLGQTPPSLSITPKEYSVDHLTRNRDLPSPCRSYFSRQTSRFLKVAFLIFPGRILVSFPISCLLQRPV